MQRLVRREQVANAVQAHSMGFVDGVSLGFIVLDIADGQDADDVEARALEELERFSKEGPTAVEMESALAQAERSWLHALASQEERADAISQHVLLHDDPQFINTYLDRLTATTAEQVQPRRSAGCDRRAGPSSPTWSPARRRPRERPSRHHQPAHPAGDSPATRGGDSLPARPEVVPPQAWAFPEPQRHDCPTASRCWPTTFPASTSSPCGPSCRCRCRPSPASSRASRRSPRGSSTRGTARHTSEEFAELLERKGIALGAGMTDSGLSVDLDVPKRRLPEALDLLRQALADPVFPEPEVTRHIKTRLAEIEQERAMAPHRAAREFIATFFDSADRASRPSAGTAATVSAITREDIAAFHRRFIGPRG